MILKTPRKWMVWENNWKTALTRSCFKWNFSETNLKIRKIPAKNSLDDETFQRWFSTVIFNDCLEGFHSKRSDYFWELSLRDLFKWNFSETILKIRKIPAKNSVVWEWFEKVSQWIVLKDCSQRMFSKIVVKTHFKWNILRVSKNDFEK